MTEVGDGRAEVENPDSIPIATQIYDQILSSAEHEMNQK